MSRLSQVKTVGVEDLRDADVLTILFRIHVELDTCQAGKADSLSGSSGALLGELPLILSEAASLDLKVVGLSLNLRTNGFDQEENLGKIKAGLDMARKAVAVARDHDVHIETLHLGQICDNATNLTREYSEEVNNILKADLLNNIKITAEASNFLVASSTVLATRIIGARARTQPEGLEYMKYYINESVFGIFSGQLGAEDEDCLVPTPLPLGGGGHRKGLSGKLMETAILGPSGDLMDQILPLGGGGHRKGLSGKLMETTILGPSGDHMDQILPLGDILLPRMEEGDWLLFPGMGTMNLAEYVHSGRKIKGINAFICLKESSTGHAKAGSAPSFRQTCEQENVININLDLQNQNVNFKLGSGLKGEVDLRKTFIFGD